MQIDIVDDIFARQRIAQYALHFGTIDVTEAERRSCIQIVASLRCSVLAALMGITEFCRNYIFLANGWPEKISS